MCDLADSGMRHGLTRAAFVAQGRSLAAGATLAEVRETGRWRFTTTRDIPAG